MQGMTFRFYVISNIYAHVRLEDAKDDLERTAIREQLKKEMALVDMEEAKRALRVSGI